MDSVWTQLAEIRLSVNKQERSVQALPLRSSERSSSSQTRLPFVSHSQPRSRISPGWEKFGSSESARVRISPFRLPVMGRTEGAPYGMIDKHGARRRYSAHDVMGCADDECGNFLRLDNMRYETDGLVAEGSIGYEQGEIDFGLAQFCRDRWR